MDGYRNDMNKTSNNLSSALSKVHTNKKGACCCKFRDVISTNESVLKRPLFKHIDIYSISISSNADKRSVNGENHRVQK